MPAVCLVLVAVHAACAEPPGAGHKKALGAGKGIGTDSYGDPLPAGAVARLGTTRLRQFFGVANASFSPDGRLIATTGVHNSLAGACTLYLWDRWTGRRLGRLGGTEAYPGDLLFSSFAFTPDSRRIVAGDWEGENLSV
jgi:hypothetical protein